MYLLRLTIDGGSDVDHIVEARFDLPDAHTDEHVAKVARGVRESYRAVYGERVAAWTLQQVELTRDVDFSDDTAVVERESKLGVIAAKVKPKTK